MADINWIQNIPFFSIFLAMFGGMITPLVRSGNIAHKIHVFIAFTVCVMSGVLLWYTWRLGESFTFINVGCLLTYFACKSYSFFTGANHIGHGIPKGTPGDILSAGFILPLNICVGLIVACTMYGFYALFTKGDI